MNQRHGGPRAGRGGFIEIPMVVEALIVELGDTISETGGLEMLQSESF